MLNLKVVKIGTDDSNYNSKNEIRNFELHFSWEDGRLDTNLTSWSQLTEKMKDNILCHATNPNTEIKIGNPDDPDIIIKCLMPGDLGYRKNMSISANMQITFCRAGYKTFNMGVWNRMSDYNKWKYIGEYCMIPEHSFVVELNDL